MAQYLRDPHGERLAAAIWGGSFLLMGSTFLTVQWHLMIVKPHLLDKRLTPKMRRAVLRRNAVGVLPYALATAGAAITPYITLVICGLVAVFYALPATTDLDLRTNG
jgi:fatty acid desaturase